MDLSTREASKAPAVGQNFRMAAATGLMRFGGMTFPGNGVRMNCPGLAGSGRVVSGS